MDETRTFIRNVASLTTANFFLHIVGAVVSILVINHLGEERYGAFKTAMSFATVFLIFAETGVGTRLLYDRSGDKANIGEHFGAALVLQMAPYCLTLLVTVVCAHLFRYPPLVVMIVTIVSAAAVLRILAETCERVINCYQQIHLTAILRGGRFLLIAAGGVIVIAADRGPVAWAVVTLVAMLASAAGTLLVSLRFARPKLVVSTLWPTLAASYVFGLTSIFFAIYENVDAVLLSKLLPGDLAAARVGIYGSAYTLIMFTYTLPASFIASMEPLAFAARGDYPRLAYLGNLSNRSISIVAVPLSLAILLLAGDIRGLILPNIGPDAATVLMILALFGLLRFVSFPASMMMVASGMQNRRVVIQGLAVVFNIAVNFIMIRRYGIFGAAVTTVATEALILASYHANLLRRVQGYARIPIPAKTVVAAVGMGLLIAAGKYVMGAFLPGSRFAWLAIVPVATVLYFALLALMHFFTDSEKQFVKNLLAGFLRFGGSR